MRSFAKLWAAFDGLWDEINRDVDQIMENAMKEPGAVRIETTTTETTPGLGSTTTIKTVRTTVIVTRVDNKSTR